jgi:hypothetical protein
MVSGSLREKDKISNSVPVGTTKLSNHQDLKKENL